MLVLTRQKGQKVVIEVDGVQRLERQFKFKDFAQALAFVNRVGAAAEEEDHQTYALNSLAWDNKIRLLFYFIGFLE